MWRSAAMLVLGADGRFIAADAAALELLGVASIVELRITAPASFAVLTAEERAILTDALREPAGTGLIAELAVARADGELIRVRAALIPAGARYRLLFFPLERPTANTQMRFFSAADALHEWRSADGRLTEVDPDSEEAAVLAGYVELLKVQYQELFDRRLGASRQRRERNA